MIGHARIVLIFAIACATVATARQPARDTVRVAAGTASISGTVFVAGEAKQPARRVRVTLTNVARTSPGQTTTTSDSGAFTFRGLPAGQYELQAFKNAYLRTSYGASRPDRAGTPVVVKDGEAVTNLAMSIARGGVITGAVRDIGGRPVPAVSVRVLPSFDDVPACPLATTKEYTKTFGTSIGGACGAVKVTVSAISTSR